MPRDDQRGRIPELPPSPLSAEELDKRWFQECERRWQAVQRGEDVPVSWEEARKFIVNPTPRRR